MVTYTSHTTKIINRNTEKANFHEIIAIDYRRGIFKVRTGRGNRGSFKGGMIQTVDLNQRNCTCNKLEICHLPCYIYLLFASNNTFHMSGLWIRAILLKVMQVHTNLASCQWSIRGHGLNTQALNLDMIPIKFVINEGLSLRGLLMKWMKEERNAIVVVVVGVKVTILEPVTPGNILYILY